MYLSKLIVSTAVAASALGLGATVAATAVPTATAAATARTTASAPTTAAASTTASAPTTAAARLTVARAGAGWLARELSAGHGHLSSSGSPDVADTAYAVLGLHAAGVGRAQADQALSFLTAHLGAPLRDEDGTDDPGRLGDVIMAAVASGRDPYHFGGRGRLNDLPARLLATARTSGADVGLFGTGDPTYDGAFRQGTALAALAAARVPAAAVRAPLAWLTRQQCANGLWTSYRASTTTSCPAADPATFTGPDTNSTSLAVQGLAAYRRHPRRSALVTSLDAVRTGTGGFPDVAAPGQSADPDSTALSIQTLLASRATVGPAYAALAGFQLGCSDPVAERGAFFYPGDRSANVVATVQSVPAAAGRTLPLGPSRLSAQLPTVRCPSGASRQSALVTAPAAARLGTAGACKGTSGVTVTVDFKAFGTGEQTRCAPGAQTSGVTALQHAGFTPAGTRQYGLAFVCRIDNRPTTAAQPCTSTPPPTAYWGYFHASAKATTWSYATTGASSYKPAVGTIEAWAFGNGVKPTKTPAQVRASKS